MVHRVSHVIAAVHAAVPPRSHVFQASRTGRYTSRRTVLRFHIRSAWSPLSGTGVPAISCVNASRDSSSSEGSLGRTILIKSRRTPSSWPSGWSPARRSPASWTASYAVHGTVGLLPDRPPPQQPHTRDPPVPPASPRHDAILGPRSAAIIPRLVRRITAGIETRATGATAYLEHGTTPEAAS